jgi:hypothetical protein
MVTGEMLVNIPVCRELVRRQRPASKAPLLLAIPAVAWAAVFGWRGWAVVLIGLGVVMSVAVRDMVVLGRTLWIMHPGNSYWRWEIDDEQIRVINLRGITRYHRRLFKTTSDLGPFWRISTPLGLAAVVVPKAAFTPVDQVAVDAYLRRSPTVAA